MSEGPGSTGATLRAGEGEGDDGRGVLSEGKRGQSPSAELSVGGGRGLEVKGDSLELGRDWVSSENSTKFQVRT